MYMDSNNNQGPGIVNGVLPSKGDEENDTQALLSSAHSDKQQCAPSGQAVDDGRAHRETRAEQGDAQEPEETVDEVLERMGFTRTHWFLFLVTGLIWGADAMSVMLMSFLGPAVCVISFVACLKEIMDWKRKNFMRWIRMELCYLCPKFQGFSISLFPTLVYFLFMYMLTPNKETQGHSIRKHRANTIVESLYTLPGWAP